MLARGGCPLDPRPTSEAPPRSSRLSLNRRPQLFCLWPHAAATRSTIIREHAIFDELPFWHRRLPKEQSLLGQETLASWCRSFSPYGDSSNQLSLAFRSLTVVNRVRLSLVGPQCGNGAPESPRPPSQAEINLTKLLDFKITFLSDLEQSGIIATWS